MAKQMTLTLRHDAADQLTLGDLAKLERFGKEGESVSVQEVIDLLGKVLKEDPNTIPLSQFRQAVDMIAEALKQAFGEEEAKN